MVAASGSKVEGYRIEDVRLEFKSLLCNGLREEDQGKGVRNLAMKASREYWMGKQLFFEVPFFLREIDYPKEENNSFNVNINPSLSMINSVIILFKDPTSGDSERFENASIESVNISVEAEQSVIFTNDLHEERLYDEARRVFGKLECQDQMNRSKFYDDAYCLTIDFTTISQDNVIASGTKLKGT